MPDLNTTLHLDMLRDFQNTRRSLPRRILGAVWRELGSKHVYGLEWGDPEIADPLRFIKLRYLLPHVNANHVAVEIGPGGGRWTRYLLGFKHLYLVDYHPQVLAELQRSYRQPNMTVVANNGTDFPGIAEKSVDFVFSFGTFVHLEQDLIREYLVNLHTILKPGGNVVIHYSDKGKVMARENEGFADNDPETMRRLVLQSDYRIVEEDLTTMWHSSLIRFTPQS